VRGFEVSTSTVHVVETDVHHPKARSVQDEIDRRNREVRDRVEGMSSTVDVAMHFGRPTIVSAINVSPAWITRGAGGERVDSANPRSVARGIQRAFDVSHVERIDAASCFGGFTGAVDALAGRRRFTPADLPRRLRTGNSIG
jgi:glycosyltransferase involved in cell wall biosynthesis